MYQSTKTNTASKLTAGQRQACGNCGFAEIGHDPVIKQCKEQFWKHLPGSEGYPPTRIPSNTLTETPKQYLEANPHDVPGLMLHLYSFYLTRPAGDNIFCDRPSIDQRENATDPFRPLPAELKTIILSDLSSQDIASLRQMSRCFQYLPKELFLLLIQKELPWFWEFEELETFIKKVYTDHCNIYGNQALRFNCNVLYKQLCLAKKKLLGIRNRVRIWNLAEAIVERIRELRDGLGGRRGSVTSGD